VNDRIGMAGWRNTLFVFLSRNARRATNFFQIPPDRVVEIGMQVELGDHMDVRSCHVRSCDTVGSCA
jgi:hypothetical protein